ncbi:lysozyme inhibitor LprI family protein [Kosakonia sp.]|uniref:lysozyme inhibitor LprI family protein n=1 Tax=Kosakonia sp. TaxID=1916651 RepID=UPI0028A00A8F|nr:lysozyme inhibitor LprI family protein [Kosakonia sp.]
MKKYFLLILLFFIGNYAFAAADNMTLNQDVAQCIKKYADNDDECLGGLSDTSESDLTAIYHLKLKEISEFDYTRWWRGTPEQKARMLTTFKQNQQDWIQYRNNYCELASTQAQGTHAFTENMLSCVLNMNTIRAQQIRMITP